jgi:hypothetical protein
MLMQLLTTWLVMEMMSSQNIAQETSTGVLRTQVEEVHSIVKDTLLKIGLLLGQDQVCNHQQSHTDLTISIVQDHLTHGPMDSL